MINLLISFGSILILLMLGKIFEVTRRLISLLVDGILKLLNLIGFKVFSEEHTLKTSKAFKKIFKDISVVKKSKENNKLVSSINVLALIVFILSSFILGISFLYEDLMLSILRKFPLFDKIENYRLISIVISASIASVSFSISKLISQWKETEKDRKARKEIKLKSKALSLFSSKELLEEVKRKDIENFNRLAPENNKINQDDKTKHGRYF